MGHQQFLTFYYGDLQFQIEWGERNPESQFNCMKVTQAQGKNT